MHLASHARAHREGSAHANAHALGRFGEALAEQLLIASGAQILARNYAVDGGEADLVVLHDGDLVAVEVKARDVTDAEAPEEAVRWWKLKRIILALTSFAAEADLLEGHWRIDLVAVETDQERVVRVEHIRDIFPP
jgi:putative endonuclease